MRPNDLFDQYKPGDSAPCFYCDATLTWEEMQPTVWGHLYRENVCSTCRVEEISNGGWMLRDPVSIKKRQEHKHAVLTNITEAVQVRPVDEGADLRVGSDGLTLDEQERIARLVREAESGGKARHALRRLRRAFTLSP